MNEIEQLTKMATQVRRDIIRMVSAANSGHPGGSLSSADIMTALYFNIMDIDPKNFTQSGAGEDVFYLSIGHISPVLYSVMARRGYFDIEELNGFRKIGSKLQGHPSPAKGLNGIRMATGSLGQGLSCALGHAIGKKMDGDAKYVYVLMGDGETQEGQIWEAALAASSKRVDNLIAFVDRNNQQIDGSCNQVIELEDYAAKWRAFGWVVLETNGHDIADIIATIAKAKELAKSENRPAIVLLNTDMGHGVDFMAGTCDWHGKAPNKEQAERALAQLEQTLGDF